MTQEEITWRDIVHPAADLFPMMSPNELIALGEDIKVNGLLCPIVIWRDTSDSKPVILDGRNRLAAIEAVWGKVAVEISEESRRRRNMPRWKIMLSAQSDNGQEVDLEITTEEVCAAQSPVDPYAYAVGANLQRRHLTAEQRRELIATLIKAEPAKSDRQIATQAKADHKTVAAVRRKGEARGEIPHVARRADTQGRAQPATKSKPVESRVASPNASTAPKEIKKSGAIDVFSQCLMRVRQCVFETLQEINPSEVTTLFAELRAELIDLEEKTNAQHAPRREGETLQ